jgi:hypothetical protein
VFESSSVLRRPCADDLLIISADACRPHRLSSWLRV